MWLTMAVVAGVALCIGAYLAIGSVRHGARWIEVLPPAALLTFGIALAAGLLLIEGELFPVIQFNNAGMTYYLSMGIPSIISIAICTGIAKLWGKLSGSARPDEKRADPK